ncbi:hypothetical protein C0Q70_11142 [Pomacea canaliculata]|uniref:Uncharacterized protein n=1 Tax=Pomacea canaliculata TaxID=400727 RepID=A0A2T7P546_POMCA|nr:hypothetical protein C0Q70_11142 [Pomacea canaliculata]
MSQPREQRDVHVVQDEVLSGDFTVLDVMVTRLAIIAAAIGAGVLVVFCLVAVLLVCLRRARRTDSYKSSSRNSDVTSSEQPGPARGQRSDTSAEVTIETSYMLANELSSSPCDAQYSYVTHSLQHSYTNQKDLGRSDTGHVLLTPRHEESAEMYSYTYVDIVDKDTKDSRGLCQPSTATYTNSRMLASSGGIGPQDPDLSLQGDTAESPHAVSVCDTSLLGSDTNPPTLMSGRHMSMSSIKTTDGSILLANPFAPSEAMVNVQSILHKPSASWKSSERERKKETIADDMYTDLHAL